MQEVDEQVEKMQGELAIVQKQNDKKDKKLENVLDELATLQLELGIVVVG
mgnify:CR=1 FL=1